MNPSKPAHYPLDALWQPPALVWVLLGGEGLAIILALAPGAAQDPWVYFGLLSLVIQWVALLTLAGLYVLRNRLAGVGRLALAYVSLGLLLVSTWVVTTLVWLLTGEAWSATPADWLSLFARATGIVLTVGLLGLAIFQNYWRARQSILRAKQSELEALHARIDPHFLFNTLNTGIALVRNRPEATQQLLLDLADLFRAALSGPRLVPLADELELTRRYLEIEQLRFGPRLRVDWQLPDPLPAVDIPILSIQPLVENAIRHGIEQLPGGGDVGIGVTQADGVVAVTVSNTLPGGDLSPRNGHNVGLASARARVESLTAGRGGITTSRDGHRYLAVVSVPAV